MKQFPVLALFSFIVISCEEPHQTMKDETFFGVPNTFGDYWYQGKAELTSYHLTQVRYGEERSGDAVLVFVTEDFSKEKQVKLDNPGEAGEDAQKVLKLNFTKKFQTGIYPYSLMTSAFSPVYPKKDLHAVKVSTSAQEWCGHAFMQFNKTAKHYKTMIRSYFESEGDQDFTLDKTWLEDEIWNTIRLNPKNLPEGKSSIIPSSMYLRLKHKETKAYDAMVTHEKQDSVAQLRIDYPDLKREITIWYSAEFPFTIQQWEETYPEGKGLMTTRATLNKRIMTDYWNKNSKADSVYRQQLGLEQ